MSMCKNLLNLISILLIFFAAYFVRADEEVISSFDYEVDNYIIKAIDSSYLLSNPLRKLELGPLRDFAYSQRLSSRVKSLSRGETSYHSMININGCENEKSNFKEIFMGFLPIKEQIVSEYREAKDPNDFKGKNLLLINLLNAGLADAQVLEDFGVQNRVSSSTINKYIGVYNAVKESSDTWIECAVKNLKVVSK